MVGSFNSRSLSLVFDIATCVQGYNNRWESYKTASIYDSLIIVIRSPRHKIVHILENTDSKTTILGIIFLQTMHRLP